MPDWFPPQEPDYGDDCVRCYAPGLTPRVLGLVLTGIEKGNLWFPALGQPPNGTYVIEQQIGFPCTWLLPGAAPLDKGFQFDAVNSWVLWEVAPLVYAFTNGPVPVCTYSFANWFDVPAGNHFYGGTCQVIPLWEASDIIEEVTPIVDPDPLLKINSVSGSRIVVSYIDSWGDTKVKILFDRNP